jgi:ELWxxDGT repeat protein
MSHRRTGSLLFVLVLALVIIAEAGAAPQRPQLVQTAPAPIKDINPAPGASSEPNNFELIGSTTYFTADDGTHGRELWRTDGTAAGTTLVHDINPGPGEGTRWAYAHNGRLFLVADDGVHGFELWISDGTAAGTAMVTDILTGSAGALELNYDGMAALGDTVFFAANDGVHGRELWRTDGTAAGTAMVKAVDTGSDWGVSYLTVMGDRLFFLANSAGGPDGYRLWRSDGTAAGTIQVSDLRNPEQLVVAGNRLYFAAHDSADNFSIWSIDTSATTASFEGIVEYGEPGPYVYLFSVANLLYKDFGGPARWEGRLVTPNWTLQFRVAPWMYLDPYNFTEVSGDVFFAYGGELWRSAGGTGQPAQVYDINPGEASSHPSSLINVNDRLYFVADDGVHGREFWRHDPATGQTNLVADILPGTASLDPFHPYSNGSMVFFTGTDAEHGRELWVVPGTTNPDGDFKAYLPIVQRTGATARSGR